MDKGDEDRLIQKVRSEPRLQGGSPARRAATAKVLIGNTSVTFPYPLACWRNSTEQGRQAVRSDGAGRLLQELGF